MSGPICSSNGQHDPTGGHRKLDHRVQCKSCHWLMGSQNHHWATIGGRSTVDAGTQTLCLSVLCIHARLASAGEQIGRAGATDYFGHRAPDRGRHVFEILALIAIHLSHRNIHPWHLITLLKTAVRIAQESPFQRVARMRRGSTTRDLQSLAGCLGLDTKEIHRMLGIPRRRRGTDHAVGKHPVLSLGETERVVGLWQLIGQVQALATPSAPAHSSSVCGFGVQCHQLRS